MLGKINNDCRCRLIYKANPVLPNELDFLKFPGLTRVNIIDIDSLGIFAIKLEFQI